MNCLTCDIEFLEGSDGDQHGFCGDCLRDQVAHTQHHAHHAVRDAEIARLRTALTDLVEWTNTRPGESRIVDNARAALKEGSR